MYIANIVYNLKKHCKITDSDQIYLKQMDLKVDIIGSFVSSNENDYIHFSNCLIEAANSINRCIKCDTSTNDPQYHM